MAQCVRTQLQERITYAENLINQLSPRLQQLREATVAKRCAAEIQSLKAENENLRLQVATMVKRLSDLETANGVVQAQHPTATAAPTSASTVAAAKSVKPVKQDVVKEKKTKSKAEGKKLELTNESVPVDASRMSLIVGRIIDVKKHPDADSLYIETVDLAEERGPRTIISGLVKHVPIEQMQNRLAVFLCNLKPAKMRGILSEGMIMCASTPDRVQIIDVPEGAVPGDQVTFSEYPGEPDKQMNPKKKIWEAIQPDLHVNSDCVATYKGCPFSIEGKGVCRAPGCSKFPIK